jgi:drug/metabolite transporter (DMT)-like permease
VCGLASAALFGVSAPLAKLLLPRIDTWVLAGLLYVGAGVGLLIVRGLRGRSHAAGAHDDDGLGGRDLPLLLGIAIIGDGIGPVLMLVGLRHLSGVAGALLLNLDAVFTALLAVTAFGERLTRLEGIAAAIIIAGAVMISAGGGTFRAESRGVLAIKAACLS